MKFAVVLFALLGLGFAAPRQYALEDDLNDFLNLIPREEIRAVIQRYADSDEEVQNTIRYLQGDEWQQLLLDVGANELYQAIKQDLIAQGIDVDAVVAYLHEYINGIIVPPAPKQSTFGMADMVAEIKALIPTEDLIALRDEKLQSSPEFAQFWEGVTSERTHTLVEQIRALPEVQRVAEVLVSYGLDPTGFLNSIYEFLGWAITTRDLITDLQQLWANINVDLCTEIINRYLQTDADVQRIVTYLQGPEFQQLVDTVAALPEWQELRAWLEAAGLPIADYLTAIGDYLNGFVVPTPTGKASRTVGDMLDEIMNTGGINLAGLLETLNNLLSNSAEFTELWTKVSSEETHQLVETVLANAEVVRLLDELRGMGVDVDGIKQFLYDLLGWTVTKRTTRDLITDLQQLLANINVDICTETINRYLQTDADVQRIVTYLQGAEFQQLVDTVAALPEWQELRAWLEAAGLPIADYLTAIGDYLNGFVVPTPTGKGSRTVSDMLDEIMNNGGINLAGLLETLNNLLSNSVEFQELWTKVSSEETHQLVETVLANPEAVRLLDELRGMGVDVDGIKQMLYDLLGWTVTH